MRTWASRVGRRVVRRTPRSSSEPDPAAPGAPADSLAAFLKSNLAMDGEGFDFKAAEEPIKLVKRSMNGCASDQAADRAILQVAFGGEADRQSLRGASPRGRRVVGPL